MRRLISLDVLRGLAIFGVIFYHATIFNIPPPGEGAEFPDIDWVNAVLLIITYFAAWAGMFGIISGTSNTISSFSSLKSGKLKDPKQMLYSALFSGAMIVFMNYVYLLIFCPGWIIEGEIVGGYLPLLIREGTFYPSSQNGVFATALIMIGWSIILSGIVLYFLMRKEGSKKTNRNYIILFALGTFFILIYPIIASTFSSFMAQPLTIDNYLPRLVVSWLVGAMDPIFPYFGFALYGMIFGMAIADGVKKRRILSYGYGLGLAYTLIAIVWINFGGAFYFPSFAVPPLPTILSMLGPMLLLFTLILHLADYRSEEKTIRMVKRSRNLRRFSVVSLTMFLLEGSMAQILRHLVMLVYPGLDADYLFLFFIFGTLNLLVWMVILKLWEKHEFKYSFEWLLIALARKVTGKQSLRLGQVRNVESYIEKKADQNEER
jgi:uncharacterized membrane protein